MNAMEQFFSSNRKLKMAILSSIIMGVAMYKGVSYQDALMAISPLLGFIGMQGIADALPGKEAAKENRRAEEAKVEQYQLELEVEKTRNGVA
jgi:hypothetical protein